jgi:hypothetical protein
MCIQPRQRTSRPHRGIAMLLVMISLMAATVATTAYLSSRDNSVAIGENSVNTTAARWAADTGIELAVAVLETKEDWRTLVGSQSGTLMHNHSIGNASVTVTVHEFGTGAVPSADTENVQIVSSATTNGVTQTSMATAIVPTNPDAVDVDLSEFAVFVNGSLNMSNEAMVSRWPTAPYSKLGRRISVGTRSGMASSIALANSSAAIDVDVYHGPGASGSLISNTDSPPLLKVAREDLIPFPLPASHGELAPLLPNLDLLMNGGTATVLLSARYDDAELRNNAVRTLRGNISLVTDADLRINTGAKLVIDGNVKIVVFGNLVIDTGSIEMRPGARLRMYVRGASNPAVSMSNAYIGEWRTNSIRDNTGRAPWIDPQRITLFSESAAGGPFEWRIENNTVVKGTIYAPHASTLRVGGTSALYGRTACNSMEMRDSAAVFYDHSLDIRCGYTNIESKIYTEDGRIKDAFLSLGSLDSLLLQLAADTTNTIVKSDAGLKLTLVSALLPTDTDNTPVTEPTPRPVRVQYDVVAFGNNIENWE